MNSPTHIRRGMTLVEMLVATTCTLILMGAIAQVFGAFGTAVSDSRSMIELDAQLRSVAWRLRNDLSGATARTLPPLEVEAGEGYFEVIEGPRGDADGGANASSLAPADIDDVLLFTTRNTETPYLGRYTSNPATPGTTQTTESQLAEVAWFLRPTDVSAGTSAPVATYTLFRRQNLVSGYVGFTPFYDAANRNYNTIPFIAWASFFDNFDLSVQYQAANGVFLPNSLADLTRRENRFMHNGGGVIDAAAGSFRFPDGTVNPTFQWQATPAPDGLIFDRTRSSARVGEDVVLTNVIGFDVRVFDPGAPVGVPAGGDSAVVPGDSGLATATVAANGAYVDLGWYAGTYTGATPSGQRPRFAALGEPMSGLRPAGATGVRVWDTWSTHYESNGIDDGNAAGIPVGSIDEGSNGLDDDGDGKVDESPYDFNSDGDYLDDEDKNSNGRLDAGEDANGNGILDQDDPGELETLPPYRFPLRGIEIRLRCYEPSSRQVRQVTIRHSFVPR